MNKAIMIAALITATMCLMCGCSENKAKTPDNSSQFNGGQSYSVSDDDVISDNSDNNAVSLPNIACAEDFPEYDNIGIYDDITMLSQPNTQGPPETLDELMALEEENEKIESFYRIRINRVLEKEEASSLKGWTTQRNDQNHTFYEATIEYDYFADHTEERNIIFCMPGTIVMQREGNPPFSEGDIIAGILQRKEDGSDITRLFKCYAFLYDIIEINGFECAMVRGQAVPEVEEGLDNILGDESISVVTTTTSNPVKYFGGYNVHDLAQSIKMIINDKTA